MSVPAPPYRRRCENTTKIQNFISNEQYSKKNQFFLDRDSIFYGWRSTGINHKKTETQVPFPKSLLFSHFDFLFFNGTTWLSSSSMYAGPCFLPGFLGFLFPAAPILLPPLFIG